MSNEEHNWFHCGSCGKLYSGEVDFSEDRTCPHCGEFPAPALATKAKAPPLEYGMIEQRDGMQIKPYKGRRRQKGLGLAVKLILGWVMLLALIFGVMQWVQRVSSPAAGSTAQEPTSGMPDASAVSGEGIGIAPGVDEEDLKQCRALLERFLVAETQMERIQLSLPIEALAAKMERFYEENEALEVELSGLELTAATSLDLPEGKAILTQWESGDAASFDAVFRQDAGRWKLDWEHFVRYSDLSWTRFHSGSGADRAVFRLHARRRMASKEDPFNSIGVVLSSPVRRQLQMAGYSAAVLGLPLDQSDGQLLELAFEKAEANESLFDAAFRSLNPEGMIRVTVEVQREKVEGLNRYRILRVLACHWMSSAASVVE